MNESLFEPEMREGAVSSATGCQVYGTNAAVFSCPVPLLWYTLCTSASVAVKALSAWTTPQSSGAKTASYAAGYGLSRRQPVKVLF